MRSFAAACVENGTGGAELRGEADKRLDERGADAAIEKAAARPGGFQRVARVLRSPLVRLQQVAVAALRDVEGVPPRARPPAGGTLERLPAVADGADQPNHVASLAEKGHGSLAYGTRWRAIRKRSSIRR